MCQGMNDQQRRKHCKYVQVQKKEGVSKRFAAALHTSALLKSLLLFGEVSKKIDTVTTPHSLAPRMIERQFTTDFSITVVHFN
jgi:hypothetical protein